MPNAIGDIQFFFPCYANLEQGEGDGIIVPNQIIEAETIEVSNVRVNCNPLPCYNPYDAIIEGVTTHHIIHGHIFSIEATLPPGPDQWITWRFDLRVTCDDKYTLYVPIGLDGRRVYGTAQISIIQPLKTLTITPGQEYEVEENPEVLVQATTDKACKPPLSACKYLYDSFKVDGTPSYATNDDLKCLLDLSGQGGTSGTVEWNTEDPAYRIAGQVTLDVLEPT